MVGADLGDLGLDAAPVVEPEVRDALAKRAIGLADVGAVIQVLLPGGLGRNDHGIVVGEQSVGLEQRNELGQQESGLLPDQPGRIGRDAGDRIGEVLERQPQHLLANRVLHTIQPLEPGRRYQVRCEDEQAGVWITLELLSVGADLIPVMPFRRIAAPRGLGLEPPGEPSRDPSIGDSADVDDLILERDCAQLLARAGRSFDQLLNQGKVYPLEHRHQGGRDTVLAAAIGREQRVRHEPTLTSRPARADAELHDFSPARRYGPKHLGPAVAVSAQPDWITRLCHPYRCDTERCQLFATWPHTYDHHRGHTGVGGLTLVHGKPPRSPDPGDGEAKRGRGPRRKGMATLPDEPTEEIPGRSAWRRPARSGRPSTSNSARRSAPRPRPTTAPAAARRRAAASWPRDGAASPRPRRRPASGSTARPWTSGPAASGGRRRPRGSRRGPRGRRRHRASAIGPAPARGSTWRGRCTTRPSPTSAFASTTGSSSGSTRRSARWPRRGPAGAGSAGGSGGDEEGPGRKI